MVILNGTEFTYHPGMSLKELLDIYNREKSMSLAFDGFVVLVNGKALSESDALGRILLDNDKIQITPLLSGG